MPFHRVNKPVTVYKAAYGRTKSGRQVKVLITLLLPVGTTYHMDDFHDIVKSICRRKCRATRAKVMKITTLSGKTELKEAFSFHSCTFEYKKGKLVRPVNRFSRLEETCGGGIHFFIDKKDALAWGKVW